MLQHPIMIEFGLAKQGSFTGILPPPSHLLTSDGSPDHERFVSASPNTLRTLYTSVTTTYPDILISIPIWIPVDTRHSYPSVHVRRGYLISSLSADRTNHTFLKTTICLVATKSLLIIQEIECLPSVSLELRTARVHPRSHSASYREPQTSTWRA
jgi:hypothetical protein